MYDSIYMILVEVWPFSSLHKDRLCLLRRFCKTAKLTGGWLRGVRYSAKRSWRGSLEVARRPRGNCGRQSWSFGFVTCGQTVQKVFNFLKKVFKKLQVFWTERCNYGEKRIRRELKCSKLGPKGFDWGVRRFDGLAGALEEIGLLEADVDVTPTL